jgi:hypothetical protein
VAEGSVVEGSVVEGSVVEGSVVEGWAEGSAAEGSVVEGWVEGSVAVGSVVEGCESASDWDPTPIAVAGFSSPTQPQRRFFFTKIRQARGAHPFEIAAEGRQGQVKPQHLFFRQLALGGAAYGPTHAAHMATWHR